EAGRAYGRERRLQAQALERDVAAGAPPSLAAERHWPWFYPNADILADRLNVLRRARRGPYRSLPEQRPSSACGQWTTVRLPVPSGLHGMAWQGETGRVTGEQPYAIFSLEGD